MYMVVSQQKNHAGNLMHSIIKCVRFCEQFKHLTVYLHFLKCCRVMASLSAPCAPQLVEPAVFARAFHFKKWHTRGCGRLGSTNQSATLLLTIFVASQPRTSEPPRLSPDHDSEEILNKF